MHLLQARYQKQEAELKAYKELCTLHGLTPTMPVKEQEEEEPEDLSLFAQEPGDLITDHEHSSFNDDNLPSDLESPSKSDGTRKSHRRKNVPVKAILPKEEPDDVRSTLRLLFAVDTCGLTNVLKYIFP